MKFLNTKKIFIYSPLLFCIALFTVISSNAHAESPLNDGFGKNRIARRAFSYLVTNYAGECPGSNWRDNFSGYRLLINRDFAKNNQIPEPRKDIRVRIEIEETGAFSDREWSPKQQQKGSSVYRSEKFNFTTGSEHRGRSLVLGSSGSSSVFATFYTGKYGEEHTELANHMMTIDLEKQTETKTRNRQYSDMAIECASDPSLKNASVTDDSCPGDRQQVQYLQCPDGSGGTVGKQRIVQATLPGPKSRNPNAGGGNVIILPW